MLCSPVISLQHDKGGIYKAVHKAAHGYKDVFSLHVVSAPIKHTPVYDLNFYWFPVVQK